MKRLKRILLVTLLLNAVLFACTTSTPEEKKASEVERQRIIDKHYATYTDTIDGCEYIRFDFPRKHAIAHKGNCMNPIHGNLEK